MGLCNISWEIVYISMLLLVQAKGSISYDPESLATFIHSQANEQLVKARTGILYNISLPANFSGIEVSVVRIRSGSFWSRGANFSSFSIPQGVLTQPYVRRLAILYENLGNLSSFYYNVPGYTLIAPVVGFMAYDSSNSSVIGVEKLNLSIQGDPISVKFPQVVIEGKKVSPQCVRFGEGGSVELKNMTKPNVCFTRAQGYFSVVIPSPRPKPNPKQKERYMLWWWVLGFGIGLVVLSLLALVLFGVVKLVGKRRIRKMERDSLNGVALDTFWIGDSKMPSASSIRTQPDLESENNIP